MRAINSNWRWMSGALACALMCAGGSRAIEASTATATLTVTANVVAECTATDGTLPFGTYSTLSAGNLDQTATVSVTCTKGSVTTVGLNLGAHASGSTRQMSNGTDSLAYELYSDVGRTTVWGNSVGSNVTLPAAPSNVARPVTIYGRVAGAQNVGTGSYSDSVVVTLTF